MTEPVYDAHGRLAEVTDARGTVTRYAYFDAAGRRPAELVTTAAGLRAFGEQISWSPRGLKSAQTRQDLGGRGWVWSYDQALRLTGAVADVDPTATVANNTAVASAAGLPSYTFQPDAAQNLLARTHETVFGPTTETFPLDASGRNRPATADGRPLEYDANGNLTRKGDRRFEYDFRNRLTRVTDDGTEIARYAYDAFDRRVEAVTAAGTEATVWSGWRPVETYRNGVLHSRRLYGAGLDEIVEQQTDLDGDGTLESTTTPWYDSTGNLALLATPSGQPLERYEYTPFGKRRIQADATAPAIEQLRAEPTRLVLVLSEEVRGDVLEEAVASGQIVVEDATTGDDLEITIEFGEDWEGAGSTVELATAGPAPQAGATEPATQGALLVAEGTAAAASAAAVAASTEEPGSITAPLQAISTSRLQQRPRRVVVLNLTAPPSAGTPVRLRIEPEAVQDLFLNDLPAAWEQTFPWPTETTVVADTAPPTVIAINLLAGHLEVVFSEPPDPATAGALSVTDHTLTWTPSVDGLGLVSDQPLGTGTFTLTVDTTLADLAGRLLEAQYLHELDIPLTADTRRLWEAPDPRDTATSTVANTFGFHGLPVDEATGLVYARHRVYDPELGRFLTADPLGYVDGPNLYQYGLNNPVVYTDPYGLCVGPFEDLTCGELAESFFSVGGLKRSGHFLKGELIGVAKAPVEAVKGVVNVVRHPVETAEGLIYVATNLPTVAEQAVTTFVTAAPEEQGEVVGGILAGVVAGGAMKTAEVQKVTRLARIRKVVDAADGLGVDLMDGGQSITHPVRLLAPPTSTPNAGGRIVSFVTPEDRVFFRVFSGENRMGGFLTATPPKSSAFAREALALPEQNTAEFIQEVLVPAGNRLQRSRALPIPEADEIFPIRRGGGEQFELLTRIPPENFGTGVPLP